MRQVWSDSFVEESNVAVGICKIRKLLGGESNGHTYIETIPRRGYRFVASVSEVIQAASDIAFSGSVESIALDGYANCGKGTIAVLPFKSIGTAGAEYLGLGMADALITRLTNLRQVTVRPTSSIRKYDGEQDPILVGRELSVEWVLDGSVQKSGKRIRVTAQLVNVASGVLAWAEKFDEKFTDIFSVEDSISEQLVSALALELSGRDRRLLGKRHTDNADAYQAYLKGLYFLAKRTGKACKKGIEYFEQAILIDPKYALAYAGVADCYVVLGTVFPSRECNRKGEKACLSALALDPELAEAHASLGYVRTRQWNWSGAEEEFKRAIELNPNYASAHSGYAICLIEIGRYDEALAEIQRAHALDPLSLIINCQAGSLLYLARRYDNAIEQLRKTLALDEGFAIAHFCLGYCYEAQRKYKESIAAYQRARRGLGNMPELPASLARVEALSGKKYHALQTVERLKRLRKSRYVQPNFIALIYAALGDIEEAFRWLERAYEERDEDLALLKVDPRFDGLRADPRFKSLMERVGLANVHRRTSSE
jgi:TolB-like protein/Flp pilus assembly protein TadD